jgi:hypothetical protein
MSARKNAPLAFRISADLKRDLQKIANGEKRSTSQMCEIFLRIGVDQYAREGPNFLQRFIDHWKSAD